MPAPGCGAGFRGRVVLGVVRGSGPVAGVAGSYGPVVQAVGDRVTGWRGERPGLGADAVTAEGHAGIGRLRAGLREARVGNGFPEGSGGLLRPGVRVGAGHRRIRRGGGDRPVRSVRRWVEASGSGCCARRSRPGSSTARRGEDPAAVVVVGFFDGSERAYRLPPGPRGAGPERRRGLSLGVVRGIVAAAGPVARRPRGRAGTDRARRRAGRAGWPGRRRRRARDETGGRHRAWCRPGGDPPTRRSSWIASRGRGRRARDRRSHARRARRRGLGHGRAGPVRRSVVSRSSTRVGGLDARRPDARDSWPAAGFSRPSGGPVAAVAVPPPSRSPRSRGRNS